MEGESKSSTINGAGVSVCRGCSTDHWTAPTLEDKFRTGLMVNNSMAGAKVEFIPQRHSSKRITWYGGGPTVYDAPHMGHARTYVAFDAIRRILSDYFEYDVVMCMNITDIDDAIVKRAIEKNVDFATLSRNLETVFFQEMKLLNVKRPDVVIRVSEYVPEIITFIERIIKNGCAYESQGNVYFDTQASRSSSKNVDGRMELSLSFVNDQARVLEEGGELEIVAEKRSLLDFALWTRAKEEEPSWESPWGNGRPGWHIEHSAEASALLGFPMDIHSTGIDHENPHYHNELAQSEACHDLPQRVNYILHPGHLYIKENEISNVFKNFITIKEALGVFTPQSIRLLILLQRWDAPMNFSTDGESMTAAADWDQMFSVFFAVVVPSIRDASAMIETSVDLDQSLEAVKLKGLDSEQQWNESDIEFHDKILSCQEQVHQALLDNFDTPTALLALRDLVTNSHVYMKPVNNKAPLLLKAARYIFHILKIFGITSGNEAKLDYVSFGEDPAAKTNLMNCLQDFRKHLRDPDAGFTIFMSLYTSCIIVSIIFIIIFLINFHIHHSVNP